MGKGGREARKRTGVRILVVEDNAAMRSLIAEHLTVRGFAVDAVERADEAEAALRTARHDVVVLDLGLPDADGQAVLRHIHAWSRGRLPVIVVTARDVLDERLSAFKGGADDFVLKPFDLLELEARIRAVLRRPGVRADELLVFGDIAFERSSRSITVAGKPLRVSRREVDLLEELLAAVGRTVVRDLLGDRLYALNEPVTPNAIEAAVSRLRRSLRDALSSVTIETIRGIGYRLVAGVEL